MWKSYKYLLVGGVFVVVVATIAFWVLPKAPDDADTVGSVPLPAASPASDASRIASTASQRAGPNAALPAPIKIASLLALTGEAAEYGEGMRAGLELAAANRNAAGGIDGRDIDLVIEDTFFEQETAVSAFQKLVSVEGVRLFAGITGTKIAKPIAQLAMDENVVIVDALTSGPSLSEFGGRTYFRVMPTDALAGKNNVAWALSNGMQRPAIVFVEDAWGGSYQAAVLKALASKGIEPVANIGIQPRANVLRNEARKLKEAAPDAIFMLVYAREGGTLLKRLRQIGVDAAIYGSDNLAAKDFVTAAGEFSDGVYVALPAHVEGEKFEQFKREFEAKYGTAPDNKSIKSYDALNVILAAMQDGGTTVDEVRKTLQSGFEYEGLSGTISFDEHGDLVAQDYSRLIYDDGVLKPVQE